MLIQQDLAAVKTKLRELIGAGEPLNPEVIDQVKKAWGITIRDGFGQTETTAQIGNTLTSRSEARLHGPSAPRYKIALLDAESKPSVEGEVALVMGEHRPVGLMVAYSGSAKTAEVMRDGHYRTGDVASIDEDGYITYVGRADDVFKASDYRISPFELESVLIEHPAVAEPRVVPSPDPLRLAGAQGLRDPGRRPGAEPRAGQDIFAFTRERLAPYKRIRRLSFADLPKTISGKIRRVELRKAEERAASRPRRAGVLRGRLPRAQGLMRGCTRASLRWWRLLCRTARPACCYNAGRGGSPALQRGEPGQGPEGSSHSRSRQVPGSGSPPRTHEGRSAERPSSFAPCPVRFLRTSPSSVSISIIITKPTIRPPVASVS